MFLKHTRWAIMWALLILVLCGMPGKDIPQISFLEIINFDKFVHCGLFFILMLLTARGIHLQYTFFKLQQHPKIIALLFSVMYGGVIEIMQGTLFEQRHGDWLDFMADSIGAMGGWIVYTPIQNLFFSRFKK